MSEFSWQHGAACLTEDPELFFPIGSTGPALQQIEAAKAVCVRCPVAETCLRWALDSGQDAGVWGGLSEDERRALKRRHARHRRADEEQPPNRRQDTVPATTVRGMLAAARADGMTWVELGRLANLDESSVRGLANGSQPRLQARSERRIVQALAVRA